jgi:AcrR family transcriptional regulator
MKGKPKSRDGSAPQRRAVTGARVGIAANGLASNPKQKRSHASVRRTLVAAAELLKEKDGGTPTITEVSRRAKVSMSSIYARFENKEALVRATLARVVEEINLGQRKMLAKASRGSPSLHQFVPVLIDGMAEFMSENAAILRVLMQRSAFDPAARQLNEESYRKSMMQVKDALLRFRDTIGSPGPEEAAQSIFRVVYATIAGFLAFGQSHDRNGRENWRQLKCDLELMCVALLRARA